MATTVLVVNGSTHGAHGNSARLAGVFEEFLSPRVQIEVVHLAEGLSFQAIESKIVRADGFVFITGTYWDSWGSPLQRFLEDATASEGGDLWLGKPAAVAVLMHSVGGKEVVSRLQGVLNTFGVISPPMTGFLYSAANQLALRGGETELSRDLWRLADLEIVCHNLVEACCKSNNWRAWPVDRAGFDNVWLER